MTANIFISFASKDVKMAMTLCTALENRGYKCWISARDIQPGENFQVAIVQAIRHAKIMLLVFTANSNSSEEMTKELALASQQKMIVIPLRVEDVTPSDAFAYEFATRQWIDFFADWEFAIEQLSRRIANALRERSQGLETNDAKEALSEVAALAPVAYTIEPPAKKAEAAPKAGEPAKPPTPEPAKPAAKAEPPPTVKPEPPKPEPVAEKPAPPKPTAKPAEPIHEVRKEALDALKAAEKPPAPLRDDGPKPGINGRTIAIFAVIAVVALTAIGLAAGQMTRSHRTPEPAEASVPAPPQTPTVVEVNPPAATPAAVNAVAATNSLGLPNPAVNGVAINGVAINAPVRKKAAAKPKQDDIPF